MMIEFAKAVAIEDELHRRGIALKRVGRELVGPCPVCGGTDRFAVHLGKQLWNCRGCGNGGDVLDLVQHLDGVSFAQAVETLTGEQARPTRAEGGTFVHARAEKNNGEHEQRQRAKAGWLWSQRQPITGSIAETYLRKRGYGGLLPPTLAFLPARNGHPPAMIAAFAFMDEYASGMLGEPDNIMAVHLTMLKPDGSGKADVDHAKIVIASPAGAPIMVAPMNELGGLAITEGIEDALSVHQATGLGAWAAGSGPFMSKLVEAVARARPSCITIFADDDKTGRDNAHQLATTLATLKAKPNLRRLDFEIRLREAGS
jgi:phage/plasmid primase-like uncharacterized protein